MATTLHALSDRPRPDGHRLPLPRLLPRQHRLAGASQHYPATALQHWRFHMPALNLFNRSSDKPRLSIRERFRNAAARMMPRSRTSRAGGGTDTSRRAIMVGTLASAAVAPLPAMAAAPVGDDSELLALIHEWMQTRARLDALYPVLDEAEGWFHAEPPGAAA
jgi:hypothetical protein